MSTVGRAIALAAVAHQDQLDKAGQAYMLHVMRVMQRFADTDAQVVAVLHDVVEDTGWRLDQLAAAGFSNAVIIAIEHLTRRADESYEQFIERAARNPLACRVKLADLEDNLNVCRMAALTDEDVARVARYHRALQRLRAVVAGAA